jgi:hypothetical protein
MRRHALALASALLLSTTLVEAGTQKHVVSFYANAATLEGHLHLPAGYVPGTRLPTVVVTGAWTSVKEQMPDTYARALAEQGFAAFTFDFRGWGRASDLPGGVRFKEDPAAKIADIRAVFDMLAARPEVDANRLHGLGICASAGYMIDATTANARVRSVALVAPWLQNAAIVEAVYGGKEGIAGLIATSRAAAAKGGEIIPAAGPVGATGVLMPLGGYYFEPARGAIPAYDNKWNQASWEGWLGYLPADRGAAFDKPLTVVHSEAAAIPQGVRAFLAGYTGPAEVSWLEGIDQFSFYDRPDAVRAAVERVASGFRR